MNEQNKDIEIKKICTKCKEEKELSEFGKDKRNIGGLQHFCKKCISEYSKDYKLKNVHKVYRKCLSCNNEYLINSDSLKQSDKLNRVCKTCSNKNWKNKKHGLKKERIFYSKCYKCGNQKLHKYKNINLQQLKYLVEKNNKKLCKNCSNSLYYILPKIRFNTKPELKFKEILIELNINFIQSYKLENKIFDFYLKELNILIEIDGNYWHGKNIKYENMNITQQKNYKNDIFKNNLCFKHNIKLIRFWEDEIDKKQVINKIKI